MATELNPVSTTKIIGHQSSVDVAAIERELTALWKELGAEEEQSGVARACVLNLLVYVPGLAASREVDEMLIEITAAHPSRVILMIAQRDSPQASMAASVISRCTLSAARSKQVCCEQINLTACGDQTSELPSAVAPLILSDLPVFLWWRAVPQLGDKVFKRLIEISDRVIIDSATFAQPYGDLISLAVLLRELPRWTSITDLNWGRLISWQAMIAGFYDIDSYRPFLDQVAHVTVEYAAVKNADEAISPKALLLAGWLSSRLQWQLLTDLTRCEQQGTLFRLKANGRAITLEFAPTTHHQVEAGHIAAVTLKTYHPQPASFNVRLSETGNQLETEVTIGQERHIGRVLAYQRQTETALLIKELEILARNRVFEQAVAAAGEMVVSLTQA